MLHDPSYSHGTYFAPELGCYLGWLTHPRAYADCNPVVDERGDIALVFSGEHFVHDEGRTGHSTPECLLKQYIDVGPRFVEQINGWFSGVIVDRRSRSVLLFNDRYGVGRVYLPPLEWRVHVRLGGEVAAERSAGLAVVRRRGPGTVPGVQHGVRRMHAVLERVAPSRRLVLVGQSNVLRQEEPGTSYRGPGPSSRCWSQRRSTRRFAAPSREFSRAISGPPCRSASRSPEGWTPGS